MISKMMLTKYEKLAIEEIHLWKNPKSSWVNMAMKVIDIPINKAGGIVTNIPGFKWVVEKSIGGLVFLLNDLAHWSVRSDVIYKEYRDAGFNNVMKAKDILEVDLEHIDKVIGYLGAKYKAVCTIEGSACGFVGLPGIPADIVALVTLSQRAIGEYATYYGFDVNSQQERLFALNILGLASSPTDASKQIAMAQLVKIAQDVAAKKVWKDLEQYGFVKIVLLIAKTLGIRLTKAKLAQTIPYTGALIGGGFNAYYMNKVCDAAFYLYKERFLAEKYGPSIIEVNVKPAEDFVPRYKDNE